jgi:hypothetical protein
MARHQLSLEFKTNWNFRLAQDKDAFLINVFCLDGRWGDSDMRALNAVRLYLKVATLADILCRAKGRSFDPDTFQANPSTTITSPLLWIRQPLITDSQRMLWKEALSTLLDNNN